MQVSEPRNGIKLLIQHPVCMKIAQTNIRDRIDPESFYSIYLRSKITKAFTKPLKQLVEFKRQYINPRQTPSNVYAYIDLVDIDSEYGIANARKIQGKKIKGKRNVIKESSILYSRIRPYLKRIAYFSLDSKFKTVCSPELSVMVPNGEVSARYILTMLRTKSFINVATQKCTGTTRPRLPEEELKRFRIPIFSRDAQQSIERLLAILQRLIIDGRFLVSKVVETFDEKLDQELLPLKEKNPPKRTIMSAKKLSKRIDPEYHSLLNWMKKLRDDEIELDSIGNITEFSKDRVNPKHFPQKSFIYITIEDVNIKTGQIESFRKILGQNAPNRARQVIKQDDILLAKTRPSRGAITLVPEYHNGDIASTGFAVLTPKSDFDAEYVYAMLRTHFCLAQLGYRTTGTGYPEISDNEIAQVKIPILAKDMQWEAKVRIKSSLSICQVAKAIIRELEFFMQKRLDNEVTDMDIVAFCLNSFASLQRMMEETRSTVETEEIQFDKELMRNLKEALEDIEAGRFVGFEKLGTGGAVSE